MRPGRIPLPPAEFADMAIPVIEEAHQRTPKGQRPDAKFVTGLLYDALDAANVEVPLKPVPMVTPAR